MKKAAKLQKQEQGTAVYGATEFADISGKSSRLCPITGIDHDIRQSLKLSGNVVAGTNNLIALNFCAGSTPFRMDVFGLLLSCIVLVDNDM